MLIGTKAGTFEGRGVLREVHSDRMGLEEGGVSDADT